MKAIGIGLVVAAAALAGCTFKSTTVRSAAEVSPPPTVVYQAPPTVVYQSPAPVYQPPVVYSAPTQSVSVTYMGPNGFELAEQKADSYCNDHYFRSNARLVNDDRIAGRATFQCVAG